MKKIVVIGGGNMGFTYAEGIYNAAIANIQIIDKSEDRVAEINAMNKMKATTGYDALKDADIIFLAIKPQIAPLVFNDIKTIVNTQQLFVSVMAGMTIETIQKGLGIDKVIRCMPNLPASIQLGMTTYVGSKEVAKENLDLVGTILKSTGKAFEVTNEDMIDNTTGISGSGSAYIFYFMNAMADAAEEIGFNREEAKTLVSQTFEGAVELYKRNDISLEEWMNRVASKGGTTRAALNSFDDNKVHDLIKEGVSACIHRAKELGA
ncbi:pyrroline-5-carboxylate reductase [Ochrovirga pacifica]|uniref:pyrroline-5-carboxylate reductase n=1 Tax=Ochrovirga pacifica TaxID=1042376 RepID=UPI00025597DC|nr:pyrroline-5-carboxylate reductase [Ochrovirga pacifica]